MKTITQERLKVLVETDMVEMVVISESNQHEYMVLAQLKGKEDKAFALSSHRERGVPRIFSTLVGTVNAVQGCGINSLMLSLLPRKEQT